MDEVQWQLAGLWQDDSRPVQQLGWSLPEWVAIDSGRLIYGGHASAQPTRGRMLEAFLRLSQPEATDAHIAAFARRWGVLGLCEHDLPTTHRQPAWPSSDGACWPRTTDDGAHEWEPVEAWRRYARHARAVINVAARLHEGQPGDAADWHVLYQAVVADRLLNYPAADRLALARGFLAQQINWWLNVGNARPWLLWPIDAKLRVTLMAGVYGNPTVSGLVGALGIQLLQVVSRTDRVALCSACGSFYAPGRRPRPGQRNYCDDCRAGGAPQRDAARDHYRRRRVASGS